MTARMVFSKNFDNKAVKVSLAYRMLQSIGSFPNDNSASLQREKHL